MEIVYFSKGRPREYDHLLKAISGIPAGQCIIPVSEINEFKQKLAGKPAGRRLAIVVATSEEMLIDIYFSRSLLSGGVSSVLILPDHEKHTAALGHRVGFDHILPPDADAGGIRSAIVSVLQRRSTDTSSKQFEYTYGTTRPGYFVWGGGKKVANF